MGELEERVLAAGRERQEMDALLSDYLPFLRRQAAQGGPGLDYDDRLSLAMVSFAEVCIRNRLLDESRREARRAGRVARFPAEADFAAPDPCDRALERQALAEEIASLDKALGLCGLTFAELPAACPTQRRARTQCLRLAACVAADAGLHADFRRTGRLPQSELARRFCISVKTVEKHRKYIAALTVLLIGDYPDIRAFLPKGEVLP